MAQKLQQSDGIVSFDILINGTKIKDTVEINEIYVQMEINRIATAIINMQDGGAIGVDNADFDNSEGKDFIPGNDIKISMGYNNTRKDVFEGIIVSQNLSIRNEKSQLIVTCKDKAVKMTKGRKNAIFKDKTDSDAISGIVGNYGIQKEIKATTNEYPGLMQYNCSDWDFIVTRAEINNMLVLTDKNKLIVKEYNLSGSPEFSINASEFIIDLDLNLDGENIFGKFNHSAWDIANQALISENVTLSDDIGQGNISATTLKGKIISDDSNQFSSAFLTKSELKSWGDSLNNKVAISKIQGKISTPGFAGITAGDLIELSGFSDRFNGNAFISKVEQKMENGSWVTTLTVGRPVQWHSALPDVEDIFASGLLPPANGTQIAKVKKIHEDPDGNFRVLVTLPAFTGDGQEDGLWARLAIPYASNEAGFFFFPEIDDEVIVTFINNDPRFPVITGSMYSSKNKPKETPDEKNQFKSIYSKSGIYIKFNDEDKILEITTPGKNTFKLNDKEKSISVIDMNNNSLIMKESGIELSSPKDIKISAKGDINISADGGINVKATQDAKVDGMNVQLSAQTGFTAKGNATAEISASGQTTVKGAMVMIN